MFKCSTATTRWGCSSSELKTLKPNLQWVFPNCKTKTRIQRSRFLAACEKFDSHDWFWFCCKCTCSSVFFCLSPFKGDLALFIAGHRLRRQYCDHSEYKQCSWAKNSGDIVVLFCRCFARQGSYKALLLLNHWVSAFKYRCEGKLLTVYLPCALTQSPPTHTYMWSNGLNADHTTSATACHLTSSVSQAKWVLLVSELSSLIGLCISWKESSSWCPLT